MSSPAPLSPRPIPPARPAVAAPPASPGDMADVVQAVQRHTGFNLRQLQPAWLESCVAQQMAWLSSRDLAEHADRLRQDPALATRLLDQALQPPPPGEGGSATAGVPRASTRALLDGTVRARAPHEPLDVWVLVPDGSALVGHLREHFATLGRAGEPLRLHGPQALRAFHGAIPAAPLGNPPGSPAGDHLLGDVRQTLAWLQQALPASGEADPTRGADLIVATDLFTCWRPDLQRLWLGRLAGALRQGGLLLLGRPKALWRAPRGLRALHLDGLHWLQRSRTAPGPAAALHPAAPAAREPGDADEPGAPGEPGDPAEPHPGRPAAPGAPRPEPARAAPPAAVGLPAASAAAAASTASASPPPAAAAAPPAPSDPASAPPARPGPEASGSAVPAVPVVAAARAPAPAPGGGADPVALEDIGVLEITLGERHLTLNPAMQRLMGRSTRGALLGWSEWLQGIDTSDHGRLEQALQGSLTQGCGWQLQIRVTPAGAPAHRLALRGEVGLDGRGERRLLCLATRLPAETRAAQPPAGPADPTDPGDRPTAAEPAPPRRALPPSPGPAAAEDKLCVVTSLPGAVARQELALVYQPQLDVQQGSLRAVEALLRWNHPQHGLVAPRAFIPWAEECGLIVELGRWVLQQACQQARRWQALGLPAVPVAVNISAVQLRRGDFVAEVEAALAQAGVLPQALELELNESSLLQQPDLVRQQLTACRRLGVRVALDDFGTGPANLSRLHRLPLDKIKLDPSFIGNLCIDRGAQAIVRSVVSLGHQLGLEVVAEGVEQAQQLALLGEARCDGYQGHHATPALAAQELTRRLIDSARLSADSTPPPRPAA